MTTYYKKKLNPHFLLVVYYSNIHTFFTFFSSTTLLCLANHVAQQSHIYICFLFLPNSSLSQLFFFYLSPPSPPHQTASWTLGGGGGFCFFFRSAHVPLPFELPVTDLEPPTRTDLEKWGKRKIQTGLSSYSCTESSYFLNFFSIRSIFLGKLDVYH